MDPRIENLKSTTFFGKRLRRRQIADIQTTVSLYPGLSRRELGSTIYDLRASGLVHAERRLPGAGLPSDAGAVGGAGHSEASGEAGIDAPGSAEAAGRARVRGAGGGGHRGLERVGRSASLPWLPTAVRAPLAVLPAGRAGPSAGLPSVHGRRDARRNCLAGTRGSAGGSGSGRSGSGRSAWNGWSVTAGSCSFRGCG